MNKYEKEYNKVRKLYYSGKKFDSEYKEMLEDEMEYLYKLI